MPEWTWDGDRYRDLTGRSIDADQVREWALESIRKSSDAVAELARLLAEGKLSQDDWQRLMQDEIKDKYIALFLLGLGGLALFGTEDIALLVGLLSGQFEYLARFAAEVDGLSAAQIEARARMYVESAWQSYERGRARSVGAPRLPAYPGDGTTLCMSRCRCSWDLRRVTENDETVRWNCTWVLDPLAESCSSEEIDEEGRPRGCLQRSVLWNPLVLEA